MVYSNIEEIQQEIKKEDYEVSTDDIPTYYVDVKTECPFDYETLVPESYFLETPSELSYESLINASEEVCLLCSKTFKNRYLLLQHKVTHLTVSLDTLILEVDSSNQVSSNLTDIKNGDTNMDIRRKRLYQCQYCPKKLSYKRLYDHVAHVHAREQLICDICDRVFKCKKYLNNHVKRHVSADSKKNNGKMFLCELCPSNNTGFASKILLNIHLRNCHSDTVYECDICGSQLKCRSYLIVHKRRVHHDYGINFPCDLCHKKFRSPRYLTIHKQKLHVNSRKKVKNIKEDKKKIVVKNVMHEDWDDPIKLM